jgi:hypothetical protein
VFEVAKLGIVKCIYHSVLWEEMWWWWNGHCGSHLASNLPRYGMLSYVPCGNTVRKQCIKSVRLTSSVSGFYLVATRRSVDFQHTTYTQTVHDNPICSVHYSKLQVCIRWGSSSLGFAMII